MSQVFVVVANNTTTALFFIMALLLLRFALRKTWLAAGALGLLWVVVYGGGVGTVGWMLTMAGWSAVWLYFFFRFGWLTVIVGMSLVDMLQQFPLTVDLSAWYAYVTILVTGVVLAVAIYGFQVSLGGQPAFKDILAEE